MKKQSTVTDFEDVDYNPNDAESVANAWHGATVRRGGMAVGVVDTRKVQVTLRLSPDVLAHYKSFGVGYQTMIDRVLRESMQGINLEATLRRVLREERLANHT